MSRNRTTLVIAHRLVDRRRCRRDHRPRDGRIAERGTHEALLKRDGIYAAMWNRQREADEARRKLAETDDERGLKPSLSDPSRLEQVNRRLRGP